MALLTDGRGTLVTQDFTNNSLVSPPDSVSSGASTAAILYINYTGAAADTVLDIAIYGDFASGDWYQLPICIPSYFEGATSITPGVIRVTGVGSKKVPVPIDLTGFVALKCTLQISSGTATGTSVTIKYLITNTREMGDKI